MVVEDNGQATISCLYRPDPSGNVEWGVLRGGIDSFVFNQSNGVIISSDTKTITFDPVMQINEGSYYCYVIVSNTEDLCSDLVSLTILRELIVHCYVMALSFMIT